MDHRKPRSEWSLGRLAAVVGTMVVLAGVLTSQAQARAETVSGWVWHNAAALDTIDPAAPLDDLTPVRRSIGDAAIVGLGESEHGTSEETRLKHRVLRLLVERMGFRSIAWEEDWTTGLRLNDYIVSGKGDLKALMSQMSGQYQTGEVADVLRWLRGFNAVHADKVRFVGVEYYFTRQPAYDAVDAYVAKVAPGRLTELRRHLRPIRPPDDDIQKYVMKYMKEPDKKPYIDHAHQVYALVEHTPHRPGDRAYALALHHARQIVSFYEHFDQPGNEQNIYRDAHAAQNLKWWRDYSGDKVVYWAASAHVANAPNLHITAAPPQPEMRFPSAGSYLRRWYGCEYRTIGFTFDHGAVNVGTGQPATMPKPARDWFEQPFGAAGTDQFVLNLRTPAPEPVRRWLRAPIKTRGLAGGPDYMDGGTLGQWFDVIVHRQEVTPARPA